MSDKKIELAKKFHALLNEELDPHLLADVDFLNQDGQGGCASHEYCDANVVMHEAFTSTLGRECDLGNEEDVDLVNEAWSIAIRHGYSKEWNESAL